ncbi:hypothetical protein HELRODRAFT_162056 [Helobdella robusta]|uniref:C2 domain-containing protein n=1 Tax=Helobdella robusta TaxID=6412 RepID=T1ES73_HELRO|nr:hypothetical protein HELRODRAFT_162056 [Helobdella robusta]ESN98620.1 hypothetical protein HELRODRAFT_162056 [Helobdella robusta]
MTLQMSVWDDGGLDPDVFYGEVLVVCQDADVTGEVTLTLSLQEHDPTSGPMPTPSPKYLLVKSRRRNNNSAGTGSSSGAAVATGDAATATSSKDSENVLHGKKLEESSSAEKEVPPAASTSKIGKITRRVSEFASKMRLDISSANTGQLHRKSPNVKRKSIFKMMTRRRMSLPPETNKARSSSVPGRSK